MTKYKVKNIKNKSAENIQGYINRWIESRNHITITSINIWSHNNITYGTIVYIENEYNL